MAHWIILPVVLPALVAPFIIMVLRHHLDLQRIFSVASCITLVVMCAALVADAADGTITVYELGNWPAPFGIVLVLDRLSAMMVLLTSLLGLIIVLYAIWSRWDEKGRHFHALMQFQLMGVLGAFLTGDAFTLFVFFEVLLIASYGLMTHGGGALRQRAGVQYVVYNLIGSTLFLFALGVLYGVTGTLNMADLAVKVADLPPEDTALIRVGAILLLLVFAVKAAVLPLHFWLPAAYSNAPAPVAAFFAIMTKVGSYAILRMYTLVFGPEQAATLGVASDWLLYAALLTVSAGMIGVLGARDIGRMTAFGAIGSTGTLLIAIALFDQTSAAAAIYYMVHSPLAAAMLFLVVDLITARRSGAIEVGKPMPESGILSVLFFAAAIALAGMPPLSGFVGKLLVMNAAWGNPDVVLVWGVILVTSLAAILGLARAGSMIFWKAYDAEATQGNATQSAEGVAEPAPRLPIIAVFALLVAIIAMTVFAGRMMQYAEATAAQLFDTQHYIGAVLKQGEP